MKAMVLEAPSSLALREVERPPLSEGNVLVRVTNTGICGTDQSIYYGGIPVSYPLIMGHEAVGEIVEGEGAGGIGPGWMPVASLSDTGSACCGLASRRPVPFSPAPAGLRNSNETSSATPSSPRRTRSYQQSSGGAFLPSTPQT